MNKVYKSVWNESIGAWVAVSENSQARGKRNARSITLAAVAAAVPFSVQMQSAGAATDPDFISIITANGVAASAAAAGDIAIGQGSVVNSGAIGGTILDPSGATVPNAKVTVTNSDRNQVIRTMTTDSTGSYAAPFIPVGLYSIKVEASGFKTEERTGVVVNVSDDIRLNIKLQVGATNDTVIVLADKASKSGLLAQVMDEVKLGGIKEVGIGAGSTVAQ